MNRNRSTAELLDGTVLGPVRILFADKLRYEKAAKANGWELQEFRLQGFLTWAALNREGHTQLTYEEFIGQLADIEFEAGYQDAPSDDPTPAPQPA